MSKTIADTRLIERTVQEVSLKYLEKYYGDKSKNIYANIEERTKKIHGMKRADGLLVYPSWFGRLYTISMEAKSHKTLSALKPYKINKLWYKDAAIKGFWVTLASGVIFLIGNAEHSPYLRFLLPLVIWLLSSSIYAYMTRNSHKYQELDVLKQVFQYPANEKWITFSYDALQMLEMRSKDNLFKICEARGVGLLLVHANKQVDLRLKPQKHTKLFGDYVGFYHNETLIRNFFNKQENTNKNSSTNKSNTKATSNAKK